jgi:pyruvate dehydrogenase E2 component (dihydrolipoamide acetyltransferase)
MEEGTIAKWHKKEGELVEAGQLLIEVSTDKATVEYNALDGGYLRKILVKEGDTASVNQPIAIFTESKDESIEKYKPEGETPSKPAEKQANEKSGNAEVQSSQPQKTAQQSPEPVKQAQAFKPSSSFAPEKPLEGYNFGYSKDKLEKRVPASPLAKKLAKERGVDISSVRGSGPNERVVSKDLDLAQPVQQVAFGNREVPQVAPGTYVEEKLTQIRKTIAQRLQESKTFIPHYYLTIQIDAEPIIRARQELQQGGIKLSYNDFLIRACALALREHPVVNSGFNAVNNTIIRFQTIDISVAVDIPDGLVTPIIRHADYKNLGEISSEVRYLAQKAKENKLQPEEYKGGSFTISNLGMYGIREFIAVINPPQSAILAVGGIFETPIIRDGHIKKGSALNLTLSADHRVVDGARGAQFLNSVQKYAESPSLLLI